MKITEIYDKIYKKKQFKKDELEKLGIQESLIKMLSEKETEKLYKEVDTKKLVEILSSKVEDKSIGLKERYETEKEYLGYLQYTIDTLEEGMYYVDEFKTYGSKASTPYLRLYNIRTGITERMQITSSKLFVHSPFKEGSIVQVYKTACICYDPQPSAHSQ